MASAKRPQRKSAAKPKARRASEAKAKARRKVAPSVRKRTPARRVRIVIADDLPMDRAGMAAVLGSQPDFEVVGEANSAREAATLCHDLAPSILILALRLDSGEGRTPIATIHAQAPETPVLAVAERGEGHCLVLNPPGSRRTDTISLPVTCSQGTDCLQLAVAEGATGTIRRSASPEELFRAVRAVASGSAWYESGTATAIMRHALAGGGAGEPAAALSARELEVAELIAAGRSNKEIGSVLDISAPTVKKHVGQILTKLGLQDRLQVGLFVARNPLILRPLAKRR
jgi:DNA-binding NarL/FixJ family response regulator